MIELSKRLRMVASLVPNCDMAADVGTDHGYLAAWLLQSKVAHRVFATDIHAGPLARAKQTALEQDLTSQMEFHLCDGLQFPGADKADAVILAGMGGETMVSILEAAPWAWHDTALILQPQSKQPLLYAWLRTHGIPITQAKLCADAGKRYLAVLCGGTGDLNVTVEDLLFQARDPLFPQYLDAEIQRITHALSGMSEASRDLELEKKTLQSELDDFIKYQKAVESW